MTGEELKALRERARLSQSDLAELLNQATGKRYTDNTVSRWENGRQNIPQATATMLQALALEDNLRNLDGGSSTESTGLGIDSDPAQDGDSVPGDPENRGGGPGSVPLSPSGAYVRACTELWEIIATGIGMTGATLGSMALVQDGAIISDDSARLGEAWGKLAETNETFRNMLVGMTSGGAWLQVAVVTGSTVGKCWSGHALLKAQGGGPGGGTPDGFVPDRNGTPEPGAAGPY